MKKLMIGTFILISACLCITACRVTPDDSEGTNGEPHTHDYASVVTNPTCTEAGFTTYTCACGDSYVTDHVDKIAHTPKAAVRENEEPATCTQKGSYDEVVRCSACNEVLSSTAKTIDKIAHTPAEAVRENEVPATCTTAGSYDEVVRCSVCEVTIRSTEKPIDLIDHTPAAAVRENEVPATCTQKGSYDDVVRCSVCNAFIRSGKQEIAKTPHTYVNGVCSVCGNDETAPHEHDYASVVTQPTCTERGYTTYTCTCGDTYVANYVDEEGHDPKAAVRENEVPPTCEDEGTYDEVVRCSVCNEILSSIPKTEEENGHTVSPDSKRRENEVPATCIREGSYDEVFFCAVCGKSMGSLHYKIPKTPHNYVDGNCSVCGEPSPAADNLQFTLSQDGTFYTVSGYTGNASAVTVPRTYNGKPVTEIGSQAFNNCSGLQSVIISDGITKISKSAFWACADLTSITVPDSVTNVEQAFSSCYNLSYNEYDNAQYLGNADNPYAVLVKPKRQLLTYRIHANTKAIAGEAFYDCTSLTNITIPNGITIIPTSAFYNCANLQSITIPDSVTVISQAAFQGCNGLQSITIPNSVTEIGMSAFSRCSALTSFVIPESIRTIGAFAFERCSGLTSVTIPHGVTKIEEGAFNNCSKLETVYWNVTVCTRVWDLFGAGCTNLKTVVIGDNATSIPSNLMRGTRSLQTVTIGNKITVISDYAFYGCSNLKNVTIPTNVKTIDESAFEGCTGLTSLVIPDSVTTIGKSAFSYCLNLMSVTIGRGVTSIYSSGSADFDYAFSGCLKLFEVCNLSQLTVKKGASDNGGVARYAKNVYTAGGKSNLTTTDDGFIFYADTDATYLVGYAGDQTVLTLPSTFNGQPYELHQFALWSLYNLTGVTIPDGISAISSFAFEQCPNLVSVQIANSVTKIGNYAFSGCGKLETVTLPGGITEISQGVFSGCKSLTSITIPDGVTAIRMDAFESCSGLTSITIPDSVTTIEFRAFASCTNLTSVTIPDGVTVINGSVFSGCTKLTSITIPKSVTKIDIAAFRNCSGLKNVYYKGTAAEWALIEIAADNTELENAEISYATASVLNADSPAYDDKYKLV